jgi:hypothetical protein
MQRRIMPVDVVANSCSLVSRSLLPDCVLDGCNVAANNLKSFPLFVTHLRMDCPLVQAELKTDMHAGLSAAERRQLEQLQPSIEGLTKELAAARKERNQVRRTARAAALQAIDARGDVDDGHTCFI